MKLNNYRELNKLSYKKLAERLGFTENKVYRICNDPELCVKLIDAHRIVQVTKGEVEYCDLLGDC